MAGFYRAGKEIQTNEESRLSYSKIINAMGQDLKIAEDIGTEDITAILFGLTTPGSN